MATHAHHDRTLMAVLQLSASCHGASAYAVADFFTPVLDEDWYAALCYLMRDHMRLVDRCVRTTDAASDSLLWLLVSCQDGTPAVNREGRGSVHVHI